MYTINNLPTNIVLGRQGEKNVTSFEFDVSSWLDEFPTGIVSINVRRPGETELQVYPAIGVTTVSDTTTWLVDDVDTALAGRGTISLTLSTPGIANIKKSKPITIVVLEGNMFSTNPPSGISQWLIESTNMLSDLENAYDAMTYTFVKYSIVEPTSDEDMNDVGGAWMGVYNGTDETAPTDYTDYVWVRIAGIDSITRTSGTGAPGTTDTYTITYTDGLTTTYDVAQGNGVASIIRTSGDGTEGSLDTYTITYNNGNTSTFDVQNGIGSYLHIKYSITQPNSNDDLIDIPSAWIGISNTTSPTAPVSYLDYDWNPLKSIQSITRVIGDGSPGTTDTYRITFTDTTTQDYSVVHGNGITSIVRTDGDGSPATTDTYTITFDNGSTTTFPVTHGNGIASIVRTNGDGSPATTDTYTITFDSGATTTFPVTHGNGIASVARTSGDGSKGTTDTYTITLNDGSTTTFPVTHGSNSYIHFKYSNYPSPTDEQVTDNPLSLYIGVCSNQDSIAPTTAINYVWSKIKGEPFVYEDFTEQQLLDLVGATGDSGVYVGADAPTNPDKELWFDTDETYELDTQKWAAVDIVATQLPAGSLPTASISQNQTGTHIQVDIPTITNDDIAAMETSLEGYCQNYIDTVILGGTS